MPSAVADPRVDEAAADILLTRCVRTTDTLHENLPPIRTTDMFGEKTDYLSENGQEGG